MPPHDPPEDTEDERGLATVIDWLRARDGTDHAPGHAGGSQEVQALDRAWAAVGEVAGSPGMITLRKTALNNAAQAAKARPRRRFLAGGPARWVAAAAVLLACFLLTATYIGTRHRPQTFETAVGERRLVTLPDHSTVSLDQDSRVAVTYSRRLRDVQLLKGQAEFDVAKDLLRPFSVTAGGSRVIATGTLFNVDLLDRRLIVTLLRGGVVVDRNVEDSKSSEAVALGPSEQLVVERATGTARKSRIEPGDIEAWKLGKLIFEVEPLDQAVARANRYSRRKIIMVASAQSHQPISGVFDTGNIDAFADAVSVQLPLRAVARGGNIALVPR